MKACGFVFALIALTAGTSFAAEDAVLRAGVATAVITPPLDDRPVGVTGDRLEGVTHDIYARALVLDDGTHKLATVTYDLNCLDVATPLLRVRLRDELGIGPAYFIPLATHNHCAPIQIVPDNFAYGRWLADRSFELIEEAIAGLRGPVRLRFGGGYCYHIRSLGNAPVDYEVQVLAVTEGDTPLAILFNYPTHPLQVEYSKVGFGHVGYAVEALEAQFPGAVAMYADACGGNQFTQRGMNAPLDVVQAFAGELADVVAGVMRGEMRDVTGPLSSEREVIDLPLADPMPYEDAKKLAVHFPKTSVSCPTPIRTGKRTGSGRSWNTTKRTSPFPRRPRIACAPTTVSSYRNCPRPASSPAATKKRSWHASGN